MVKKTIGVVGGGQLCLMIGEAIKDTNAPYRLIALDPTPHCPAYGVIDKQFVGDYKDEDKIRELAEASDIITFEIELANSQVLAELKQKGMPVHPSPETLKILQDKFTQANFLRRHNIPVPDFRSVDGEADLGKAVRDYGLPLMVKARTDSYDGRGNYVLKDQSDVSKAIAHFSGRSLMAQQYIPFDVEISVISARGVNGDIAIFPVGENIHGVNYNILETTIVPARVSEEVVSKAKEVAKNTMAALKGAGVFGIEMLVLNEEVLINEIAPRVHNSGHYSIEGCYTSQFKQHIRAIAGEKLGNTALISGSAVMHNIIGQEGYSGNYQMMFDGVPIHGTTQVADGVVVHNYGKHEVKPYRKMGHLTVVARNGEAQSDVISRAEKMKDKIEMYAREK